VLPNDKEHDMEFTCGMCRNQVQMGASVCTGCQGTVIYGPTRRERTIFAVIGAFVVIGAYQSIANLFGSAGGGTAILFVGGIGVGLGLWAIGKIRSGKIRTYRYLVR
jgi:hypothetical protein